MYKNVTTTKRSHTSYINAHSKGSAWVWWCIHGQELLISSSSALIRGVLAAPRPFGPFSSFTLCTWKCSLSSSKILPVFRTNEWMNFDHALNIWSAGLECKSNFIFVSRWTENRTQHKSHFLSERDNAVNGFKIKGHQ